MIIQFCKNPALLSSTSHFRFYRQISRLWGGAVPKHVGIIFLMVSCKMNYAFIRKAIALFSFAFAFKISSFKRYADMYKVTSDGVSYFPRISIFLYRINSALTPEFC